jgi:hypothetical protein
MKPMIKFLLASALVSATGVAGAQTTWTLVKDIDPSANTNYVLSTGLGLLNIQGVANTGGSDITPVTLAASQKLIVEGAEAYSGGVGIANSDGCASAPTGGICDVGDLIGTPPEHAIDNEGRYEMALLTFEDKVRLTSLQIGWSQTDSDMTVLAYTGAYKTPLELAASLATSTWGTLSGWTTVAANLTDVALNTNRSLSNTTVSSSYWLIGAYNPLGGTFTNGYDYVKLSKVTGVVTTPCTPGAPGCGGSGDANVPEPGTLALFGAGLLGMIGLRRRARA